MGYQGHPHSHPWKLSVLQYVTKEALEKSLSSGSWDGKITVDYLCGHSKIESVLKSGRGRQNRRSERQDARKTPPTPFLALKMEQGKGTWAIREIISTSFWRHQRHMYLMVTMHHFFSKLLKFINVLSSKFLSSFSSSVSIDAEMTNTVDPHYSKILYL